MRRLLRTLGATMVLSSVVVLAWPGGAGADAPAATGWWYRPQQAGTPVAVPAPPVVPAKGLYVANGPAGEQVAMAAVEYAVPGPGSSTLKLTTAAGTAGTVAVTACPVSNGFEPVEAGAWADAPAYNCTAASVDGTVEGTTITFALTPEFVAAGATAVQAVLIPTPGAAPFQAPIERPGDDSFTGPPPAPSGSPESSGASAGSSETFDAPLVTDTGSAGFEVPVDGGGASASAPVPAAQGPALRRPAPRPSPTQPVAAASQTGDRLAAVVLLAVMGVALWWLGGREASGPRQLAAAGATSVDADAVGRMGGIGRFARHRTGRPNRF